MGNGPHVVADLREDDCRDGVADAGHGLQEVAGGTKGRERLAQPLFQSARSRCFDRVDLVEMQLQHEAMMRRHPAVQRVDELRRATL